MVGITTTFTNTGQTPYFGITISSPASTGSLTTRPVNGDQTASSGTLVDYGTGAAWTGDIPVGGTVTLSAGFTVKNPDPGSQVITSTCVHRHAGQQLPGRAAPTRPAPPPSPCSPPR